MKYKDRYIISPDPVKLGAMLVCSMGSGAMMLAGIDLSYPVADPWFLFVVSIGCTIYVSKSYVLNSQQLTLRIMFIPIQRIRWEFVKQVLLFDNIGDYRKFSEEAVFVILYAGCDDFNPDAESVQNYLSRYNKIVTKIVIPRQKKRMYKEYFEKTYGYITEYS